VRVLSLLQHPLLEGKKAELSVDVESWINQRTSLVRAGFVRLLLRSLVGSAGRAALGSASGSALGRHRV
jgi:hypothetical protein